MHTLPGRNNFSLGKSAYIPMIKYKKYSELNGRLSYYIKLLHCIVEIIGKYKYVCTHL